MAVSLESVSFISDFSLINLNQPQPVPSLTTPAIVLPKGKSLVVGDLNTVTEFRATQKTLKAWKEIARDRLGFSRAKEIEAPSTTNRKLLDEDRDSADQYLMIVDLFEQGISAMLKKPEENVNTHVRVVQDTDRNIQAMITYTTREKSLFVNLIVTAPWNLKMHAPNMDEHKDMVTKGGGTSLIASVYETAQQQGKEKIHLKPMNGSYTYYKNHLKMTEDKPEFFFPVSAEVPESLKSSIRV